MNSVIHVKTSLDVAQNQPLEFQIRPDTFSWVPMCHSLFSPWMRWQHHKHRSIPWQCWQKQDKYFKQIPTRERCANAQSSNDRSEQVLAQSYRMGWDVTAMPSWGDSNALHDSNLWDIVQNRTCTWTEHAWSGGFMTATCIHNDYKQIF